MISRLASSLAVALTLAVGAACQPTPDGATAEAPPTAGAAMPATAMATAPSAMASAEVGRPAPAFELKDLDGKTVRLADFKGKTVVVEWFNAGCPFVKAAHTKGSLKDAAQRAAEKGVVWLAVNSSASGKQGSGVDANREGANRFRMTYPVLLDGSGQVGRAYGATNTPHLFVVDPSGTLVYAGAVDNSPDGEGESPEGGKLVSYVDAAIADVAAGRPVATPKTRAYGCSVKYAN